jgi:hypothetical protein
MTFEAGINLSMRQMVSPGQQLYGGNGDLADLIPPDGKGPYIGRNTRASLI